MTKPAPCVPMDQMVPTKSPGVTIHNVPLIAATAETLRGYGTLVSDFENETVRIETWPQPDCRRVEPGTGNFGVQIHPGIWHQPVFPLAERAVFRDKQGKVHACVAVDFVKEFSTYLLVPLVKPPELLAGDAQAIG